MKRSGADPQQALAHHDYVTSGNLNLACERGDIKAVKLLLITKKYDVDWQNSRGVSPLIAACEHGHTEVVQFLLDKGANIDMPSKISGESALMCAIRGGHLAVVKHLLQKGGDTSIKDRLGNTPLLLACLLGNREIVESLLTYHADINALNLARRNPLISLMVAQNHFETDQKVQIEIGDEKAIIAQLLLDKGCIVNAQDNRGYTALNLACSNGYTESVKLLLDNDANVLHGVHLASFGGYTKIVKLLLDHGVEVNTHLQVPELGGGSPLHLACYQGHQETIRLLLDKGAEVNMQNVLGYSALIIASACGHEETVRLLVDKDADVNAQDSDGFSSLHVSSQKGHAEIVKFLMAKGARVNMQSCEGTTPLHLASQNGHTEVVKALLECINSMQASVKTSTEIDIQDTKGRTPLMMASSKGHLPVVNVLLSNLASKTIVSVNGKTKTAAAMAIDGGHLEVLSALESSDSAKRKEIAIESGESTGSVDAQVYPRPSQNTIMGTVRPIATVVPVTSATCLRQTTSELDINSLGEVLENLLPVSDHWKTLGVLLRCKEFTLNNIERREQREAMSCLREMLSDRLKMISPPLTWELIAKSVEQFDQQQAQIIRKNFCN